MKLLLSLILSFAITISLPTKVFAFESIPSFPVCSNPQGQLLSEYKSGIHGIPGDTNTYSGEDKVYQVSSTTLIQCFCPDSKAGIQTNWWKIDNYNLEEIEYYKNLGWIYIPDGSVWGLNEGGYLAYNHSYSCLEGGTGGSTDNNSLSGDIHSEGISTSVLGLAGTGGSLSLFLSGILGLILMSVGVLIRPHEKR